MDFKLFFKEKAITFIITIWYYYNRDILNGI